MRQNEKSDAKSIVFSFTAKKRNCVLDGRKGCLFSIKERMGWTGEKAFFSIKKFPTGNPMGKEKQS